MSFRGNHHLKDKDESRTLTVIKSIDFVPTANGDLKEIIGKLLLFHITKRIIWCLLLNIQNYTVSHMFHLRTYLQICRFGTWSFM